ncbi:hypothetical protein GJ744_007552 [Endocarpon pusillum]|uniref:Uncharacterized protein n=1 Tax=Endocarpon pusillum TaxID=364733 RepID=A0A8H7E7F8_9EURO|nr:hypothetical protein GJ744_007552 [Endocarpon pusillum]
MKASESSPITSAQMDRQHDVPVSRRASISRGPAALEAEPSTVEAAWPGYSWCSRSRPTSQSLNDALRQRAWNFKDQYMKNMTVDEVLDDFMAFPLDTEGITAVAAVAKDQGKGEVQLHKGVSKSRVAGRNSYTSASCDFANYIL